MVYAGQTAEKTSDFKEITRMRAHFTRQTRSSISRFAHRRQTLQGLHVRLASACLLLFFTGIATANQFTGEQSLQRNSLDGLRSFGSNIESGNNTVLVSSLSDENGMFAGSVAVFNKNSDGQWEWSQTLTASDGRPYQQFGESLSIYDDLIAVGASGLLTNQENTVYVFKRNTDGVWEEQQILTPDNIADGDFFGHAVEITDTTLVVGANGTDLNDGADVNAGSVYVYDINDAGEWVLSEQLFAADATAGDRFGENVSLANSTTLLVGSPRRNTGGTPQSGAVYIFTKGANGLWTETQTIAAAQQETAERFGNVVAVEGDTALVGSERNFDDNDLSSAYVFQRDATGTWVQEQQLTLPVGSTPAKFGTTVSLNNNIAVIGAPFGNRGSVHVYQQNEEGVWTEQQSLTPGAQSGSRTFGVRISNYGDDLFVGDSGANDGEGVVFAYTDESVTTGGPVEMTDDGCSYANADIQDGWGWNEALGQSCAPLGSTPRDSRPACEFSTSDSDGDGFGWENNQTCITSPASIQPADACVDYGTFPWGWNPATLTSCRLDANAG